MNRSTLRAMNGEVELLSPRQDTEGRFRLAAAWLRGFEARFSRFDPGSELSRLNAGSGLSVAVSPMMLHLLRLSLSLAERSGGLFDPTVLRALEAAGYDRSFELIDSSRSNAPACARRATWRDVRLDTTARRLTLPPGAGIDFGGIGKGFAADRLARLIGSPCLVNAGGDLYAAGAPADGESWRVAVEDPFAPERDLLVLAVRDRSVATSSRLRRRWRQGDGWAHHLVDPRCGAPSTSDAVQATIVAATAVEAEYHAKVALLLGARPGRDYLDTEPGVEGLIVDQDARVIATAGLEPYVFQGLWVA